MYDLYLIVSGKEMEILIMKKLTIEEMTLIKAGTVTVSKTCKGKDNGTGLSHSKKFTGSGPTSVEAKAEFNKKLRAHKLSATYINSTHSASYY